MIFVGEASKLVTEMSVGLVTEPRYDCTKGPPDGRSGRPLTWRMRLLAVSATSTDVWALTPSEVVTERPRKPVDTEKRLVPR